VIQESTAASASSNASLLRAAAARSNSFSLLQVCSDSDSNPASRGQEQESTPRPLDQLAHLVSSDADELRQFWGQAVGTGQRKPPRFP
jgi:hypothetical protein